MNIWRHGAPDENSHSAAGSGGGYNGLSNIKMEQDGMASLGSMKIPHEEWSHAFKRPPSSSLSAYGLGNDEARSPSSGGGTPGLLSHQPGSHISGDNISEAGKHLTKRSLFLTKLTFHALLDRK
jgi:hypothetical protein